MNQTDPIDHTKIQCPHVVEKPWGKEIWHEVNTWYCFKELRINAGHKTSFQYHEVKIETVFFHKGEAELIPCPTLKSES